MGSGRRNSKPRFLWRSKVSMAEPGNHDRARVYGILASYAYDWKNGKPLKCFKPERSEMV